MRTRKSFAHRTQAKIHEPSLRHHQFFRRSLNGKDQLRRHTVKAAEPKSRATPYSSIPPRRTSNASRRQREYLTPEELERVLKAAAQVGRHGHRDRTAILLAYRHGFRVSELVSLRWEQIDIKADLLHVVRMKNGLDSTHPIRGPELRALRELRRQYPDGPYVFVTERGGPLTPATFRKLFARTGSLAALPFPIHPHMLRHYISYLTMSTRRVKLLSLRQTRADQSI